MLAPGQAGLEILARNIVTACLVFLGQPREALRHHVATLPLAERNGGARTGLQASYLEALILDAMGHDREAAILYNVNITARMETGLSKDAFLTMLARFEVLYKRGDFGKAAQACEDAIERMKKAGEERHAQTIQLWRDLLALVEARRLTEPHLAEVRQTLVRSWASPAQPAAPAVPAPPVPAREPDQRQLLFSQPPPLPPRLSASEYKSLRALYERSLIEEALGRCKGRFGETCEALGMNPRTLRSRLLKYGLKAG